MRILSRLLGRELWLARDEETAHTIAAEAAELPVLLFADVPRLRGWSVERLNAVLNALGGFPGARIH